MGQTVCGFKLPLETEPECVVCLEEYQPCSPAHTPRFLPCGHTFCTLCLADLEERNIPPLVCPMCRARHNIGGIDSVLSIPVNLPALRLAAARVVEEAVEATPDMQLSDSPPPQTLLQDHLFFRMRRQQPFLPVRSYHTRPNPLHLAILYLGEA